jgi:class 3 adenylate cyclase
VSARAAAIVQAGNEFRVHVDRHKCIGAGNCITIAPTAFDWLTGEFSKAEVVGADTIEEEILRAAAASCPTAAIDIEEIATMLPWQLRGRERTHQQRVLKTFMFTDIVGSTNLVQVLGDEAWEHLLNWHDQMLRSLFAAHRGKEENKTGDGFFVGFDSPDDAIACAIAIQRGLADHRRQHGFAPQVRIGLHASEATQVGREVQGLGVHAASRIAGMAAGNEIVASEATVAGTSFTGSGPRTVTLRGLTEPVSIVTIDWR